MGRKKSTSQELERHARGRFGTIFSDWIVNSRDEEDFGFDFEVRVTETNDDVFVITPSNFFVQLKASERFENDESVFCDLDVEFLRDDCLNSPIPVVLIIYDRDSDEFYWSILQSNCWDEFDEETPGWRDQQTVRVRIDRSDSISGCFVGRSNFQSELRGVEERITMRHYVTVVNPELDGPVETLKTRMAETEDVLEYKQAQIEIAKDLIESNAKSRALVKLLEIYQMPEDDESTLDAILEMLKLRGLDHPIIALVHDEFASIGLDIARRVEREDETEFLHTHREISVNAIRNWIPGIVAANNRTGEEFLVLNVEDWAITTEETSMWIAMIQYEDGVLRDENAKAIVGSEHYEVIEVNKDRHPVKEACTEGHHDFPTESLRLDSDPAFCDGCGLSEEVLMGYLNHDVPFVFESCGQVKQSSEFTEGYVCRSFR